ncbi:MAG: biopolymer transporter ExbD [Pseudomonadota bacterium]|nr:biopolymer transporter ExbD [Pseudomonadota bacterium]
MRPRWQRAARRDTAKLDVTAFLSLMVILVPFLLITAVFSRMTILEIQTAAGDVSGSSRPDPLQLQVVVRKRFIEVNYSGLKKTERMARTSNGSELESLATLADELKARFPQSLEATLLVEPQIPYDLVVQVLDVIRIRQQRVGDVVEPVERFPLVTLGEVAVSERPTRGVK